MDNEWRGDALQSGGAAFQTAVARERREIGWSDEWGPAREGELFVVWRVCGTCMAREDW